MNIYGGVLRGLFPFCGVLGGSCIACLQEWGHRGKGICLYPYGTVSKVHWSKLLENRFHHGGHVPFYGPSLWLLLLLEVEKVEGHWY